MAPSKRLQHLSRHLQPAPVSGSPEVLQNFIGGKFVPSTATASIVVTNPATGEEIARVPDGNEADVDQAVKAAAAAYPAWRDTPVKARVEVLFRFKNLCELHLAELTALVVQEHGKNSGEAEAEVLKGVETVAFATGLPDLLAGRILEVARGVWCHEVRRPVGVVASIVPFNFPAMVPLWTLPIAIGCGNCFIIKPSEKVPLTLLRMAQLLAEAGLPAGVLSVVNGASTVAKALAEHPGISAVSFVGSSRVADIIDKTARSTGKRALCMGGAKNHLIAMPDCDEDMTISDIMNSAFGSAGQRCMAASVLIVVGKGRRAFLDKLVARAASLKAGQQAGEVGPVIDPAAAQRIASYVGSCESNGGKILLDGRKWQSKSPGFWFGPTVLMHKSPKEAAVVEEIFGPVLSVLEVDSLDAAVAIENANPYGNAAAIYTMSGQTALETEKLAAGMIGVNIGVPVPREPFSFGGILNSKFGDSSDITGEGGINFWLPGQIELEANASCAATAWRTHLAAARFYDSRSHHLNSTVYRWEDGRFEPHQHLGTSGAWALCSFRVAGHSFLAVASFFDGKRRQLASPVYRWDAGTDSFVWHQDLATEGPKDVEYLAMGVLAFAESIADKVGQCRTFRWKGDGDGRFEPLQVLPTGPAFDVEAFAFAGEEGMVVVHEDGVDVYVAEWLEMELKGFKLLQKLEVRHGRDAEHLAWQGRDFVAIAVFRNQQSYQADALVYEWDPELRSLQQAQGLPSEGGFDAAVLRFADPLLLVANQRAGVSVLYSFDAPGCPQLLCRVADFATPGVYKVTSHTEANRRFLAIANFWD
ncbi:unnamed protein product [Effrenium voratum]|nr:unnamed protein product [Effrenium voratum]